jgi:hypothetical protein
MKIFIPILLSASFAIFAQTKSELSSAKAKMIQESISQYSGNCPCPYNSMRNGRSCGRRSAYSRPGGKSPLCYENDITDEQARRWLKGKNR